MRHFRRLVPPHKSPVGPPVTFQVGSLPSRLLDVAPKGSRLLGLMHVQSGE
jgi:hypothetical protein